MIYTKSLYEILNDNISYKAIQYQRWVDKYLSISDNNKEEYNLIYQLYSSYFSSSNEEIKFNPNPYVYYYLYLDDNKLKLVRDLDKSPRHLLLNNEYLFYIQNNISILGGKLLLELDKEYNSGNATNNFIFFYNNLNSTNRFKLRDNIYYFFKFTSGQYYIKRDLNKSPRNYRQYQIKGDD